MTTRRHLWDVAIRELRFDDDPDDPLPADDGELHRTIPPVDCTTVHSVHIPPGCVVAIIPDDGRNQDLTTSTILFDRRKP